MPTITRRYLAFVSQFVDAVTNSALDEAFEEARRARRMQRVAAAKQPAPPAEVRAA